MKDSTTTRFDWNRWAIASGRIGFLSLMLVFWASSVDSRFDWRIFVLSGAAVFLSLTRNWFLVPLHLRNKDADADDWKRYVESDWPYVDALSEFSGAEIDEMRDAIAHEDKVEMNRLISICFSHWEDSEKIKFTKFFNKHFVTTDSFTVSDSGEIRRWD
jgi:hypothetical protein